MEVEAVLVAAERLTYDELALQRRSSLDRRPDQIGAEEQRSWGKGVREVAETRRAWRTGEGVRGMEVGRDQSGLGTATQLAASPCSLTEG